MSTGGVMLVAVQHTGGARGDGLTGAEAKVAQWMRTWTGDFGLPGVTVFNAVTSTGMADALVLSPYGCVVIEIDGFTRRQDGALHAPADGAWQVDGQPAALHSQNPLDLCSANVKAVRETLRAAGITTGTVPGLVVLLPTPGARVHLADGAETDGVVVVLAPHQKPLRQYFHTLCRSQKVWDANTVAAAARALKLTEHVPNVLELYQHGIPETIYSPQDAQEPAPPPKPAPAPPTPVAVAPRRGGTTRLVLVIALGLLVLVGLAWLVGTVYDVFHGPTEVP
ncbi:nuclease-related domain-containing protein [Allokutzneria oryzae]|uniref:Nuclease-related domain-containing protein n=1 Tax=Allokutzneria oryzae TaxID=1378989 RepID=A0ABV5ZX17_9PSEU